MKRVMKTIVLILLAIQVFSCVSASEKREAEQLEQERDRVAWLAERTDIVRREQEEFDRQKAEIDRQNEEAQAKYVAEFIENWKSKYAVYSGRYYEKIHGINSSEVEWIRNNNNPYNFDRDKYYYTSLNKYDGGYVNQWLSSNSILFYTGNGSLVYLHWTDSSLTKMIDGWPHFDCLFVYEGTYEYKTAIGGMNIVPKFKMVKVDYKEASDSDIKKWAIEDYEKNSTLKPTPKTVPVSKRTEFPKQLLSGFVFVKGNGKIKDFYIDECEVTQALYKVVMGENPSGFAGSANPVENVSWYEAVKFCNLLSASSGLEECYTISGYDVTCDFDKNGYRLPTETEWEYAAKGGDKSKGFKYSGSDDIGEVAWYWDNFDKQTHPVKSKKPNELGLYDMSGNVCEWCWDLYSASGSYRVERGGGLNSGADDCSVSYRGYYGAPSVTGGNLGFRLARSAQD